MAAKKVTEADERFADQDFDLFRALEALDKKDYGFYSRLQEEQQRKFVPYMLLWWMSAVKAGGLVGSYYVLSTDQSANKHMFNEYIGKHPELQWLMLCAASPGAGKQFHQWIPHLSAGITGLKNQAKTKDIQDYFSKIYSGADKDAVAGAAEEFTRLHNHKWRIGQIHPELKISDIETLATIVDEAGVEEYERAAGN